MSIPISLYIYIYICMYVLVFLFAQKKSTYTHQLNYDSHGQITEALPSETTCFVLPHADPPVPIRGVPWPKNGIGRPKKTVKSYCCCG